MLHSLALLLNISQLSASYNDNQNNPNVENNNNQHAHNNGEHRAQNMGQQSGVSFQMIVSSIYKTSEKTENTQSI